MSVGNAAAKILQRGVELDNKKRYTEALVCYQEGLQVLVDMMKGETAEKRAYLRGKIEEYMKRAEFIKTNVDKLKEEGKYSEQISIENNATGFSYEKVFGRFLDELILNVKIEDPYIRSFHQCQNLVRFCEVLVEKCPNLKYIELNTTKDMENSDPEKWLNDLKNDLMKYNVVLNIIYSTTLHDREITLSTGWIIKIGRGLDYFKAPATKFSLGVSNMNYRPCHETTINIFHSNNLKHS